LPRYTQTILSAGLCLLFREGVAQTKPA